MMGAAAVSISLEFRVITCGGCGTPFAVASDLYDRYREGRAVRCPNPRCDWASMVLRESDVQRLNDELMKAKAAADRAHQARRWAEEQREREERSHRATKGHLSRMKQRVARGTCPCCRRHFVNLERHMAAKHPDFDGEAARAGSPVNP